jgi:L-amino acid N-acyltransferase YncA
MIEVIPCSRLEMESISLQVMQSHESPWGGYADMEKYSRAVIVENRVIACVGIIPMRPGTGFAWTMLSEEAVLEHAVAITVVAYRNLLRIKVRDNLHRVQAMALEGHHMALHWLDRMGFQIEGLLEAYDEQKRNYWTMARIWK